MTDKGTPSYSLADVQALIQQGKVLVTLTAVRTAVALGYDTDGMLEVMLELTTEDFDKSTTSFNNHKEWQDVYKPFADGLDLYIKFKVVDDVVILSFKER